MDPLLLKISGKKLIFMIHVSIIREIVQCIIIKIYRDTNIINNSIIYSQI
jgi:hypothetical protein